MQSVENSDMRIEERKKKEEMYEEKLQNIFADSHWIEYNDQNDPSSKWARRIPR